MVNRLISNIILPAGEGKVNAMTYSGLNQLMGAYEYKVCSALFDSEFILLNFYNLFGNQAIDAHVKRMNGQWQ